MDELEQVAAPPPPSPPEERDLNGGPAQPASLSQQSKSVLGKRSAGSASAAKGCSIKDSAEAGKESEPWTQTH